MKKYHIQARQRWHNFVHDGQEYCLKHLDVHEVVFAGDKYTYRFVVTYGLHCFAKSGQEYSVDTVYSDGYEIRHINLERYQLSKYLRKVIEGLGSKKLLYETSQDKYFTFDHFNSLRGEMEKCKVCLCIFKENRLLRIHITSAFFDRQQHRVPSKGCSIFKIALDTARKPRKRDIPKEASR